MEQKKSISALLSIDGYKAVAVVSFAIISVYAAKKFVDTLAGATISINADGGKAIVGK